MTNYDLCLAWNWRYDSDFVNMLVGACQDQGLSLLQVTPKNLEQVLGSLLRDQFGFLAFLDRASDVDEGFNPLVEWARVSAMYTINPAHLARQAWDKAAMHTLLIDAGLQAPEVIVLPSHAREPYLPPFDLSGLGGCFAIKPVHGGGGRGVFVAATNWDQVLLARQDYREDAYLLQAHVDPNCLDGREAWFRVIYCAGQSFPFWWDRHTHVYTPVCEFEETIYCLGPLWEIPATLARICGLELFSTEIALTPEGEFMVVDYINDPIDLRLQSRAYDGVPDQIVSVIAHSLATLVVKNLYTPILLPIEQLRPPAPIGAGVISRAL